MSTLGIVGGIGPESTVAYYRMIIASYLERRGTGEYPQFLVNSINMKKMLDLIGARRFDEVTVFLAAEIEKLASAGADFAVLASNTPHIVFDAVQQASPLPLISIVEAACQEAASRNMTRVGLFGTRFTMQGGFYQEVFAGRGMEVTVPEETEQEIIHTKYMEELVKGVFREETKRLLLGIARDLRERRGIQGLILGGTELPLILKEVDAVDVPFLDTTRIHVERIMERLA